MLEISLEHSQQDGTGRVRTFTHYFNTDYAGEVPRYAHNVGTWVRIPYPLFSTDIRYFRYKLVKKESREVRHTVAKKLRVEVVHLRNG